MQMPLMDNALELPAYAVRVSRRARHVTLKVSAHSGLVVVVPAGFDTARVPAIVHARRPWILKHLSRLGAATQTRPAEVPLPALIRLTAMGKVWTVTYQARGGAQVRLHADPCGRLTLTGPVADGAACAAALRRWLFHEARAHLASLLDRLSAETGLGYERLIIRDQRTRWGSCSRRGTISLNYKLLFLPVALVRHVLLHELCHTRVMDHSPRFWRTLAEFDSDYEQWRGEIRAAGRHIPAWTARLTPQ